MGNNRDVYEGRFSQGVFNFSGISLSSSCIIRSDSDMSAWDTIGTLESFPKNHVLLRRDNVPDRFYIVKSGTVVGYEELSNGNELICYVMEKNAMLLEANVLLSRPSPVSFRTLEESQLLCISREKLIETINAEPQALFALFCSVSDKFLVAMDELREVKSRSAEWRLCELLLEFAARYGAAYDSKVLIRKRINIQLLTQMLGINRSTTVRSMRTLRDLGLIEHINGFYCVRSVEALRRHQELLEY